MKIVSAASCLLALCLTGTTMAQGSETDAAQGIVRAGSRPAVAGSPSNFTGRVSIRPIVTPQSPGRTTIGEVTFQPGARSYWHTHPAGQAFVVTQGCGWTQREGGPVVKICQGDTVYVPAGVKHWHGATPTTSMTHLAITETLDGKNVSWLEEVSDAQYRASVAK